MTISITGIAHVQFTVLSPEVCLPFWEKLCQFINGDDGVTGSGRQTQE